MGEFDRAVRALREAELLCPKCGAGNKPDAKPTLEREPNGVRFCTNCSHCFIPKED